MDERLTAYDELNMNGHDYPELFSPPDDYPGDDDEWVGETDIDCPFCDWKVDWHFDRFYCDKCEVSWSTQQEVEHDRNQKYMDDDQPDRSDDGSWWVGSFR